MDAASDTSSVAPSRINDDKPVVTQEPGTGFSAIKSWYWPDRRADLTEVSLGYRLWDILSSSAILFGLLIPLVLFGVHSGLYLSWADIFTEYVYQTAVQLGEVGISIMAVVSLVTWWITRKRNGVYLVDFSVLQPRDELKVSKEKYKKMMRNINVFTPENVAFQERLFDRTAISDDCYLPDAILEAVNDSKVPVMDIEAARREAEYVFKGVIDDLFARTGCSPQDIDILIVNVSLFVPTPSLTAMIINMYKMRSDILTYNLGGMGCSAGIISIDLARDLLQVHRRARALVISTENITQNWYLGNDRSMLIQNTLFRLGGAAILLSNKWSDRWKAKYELDHVVRVHKGANDKAYRSVYQTTDDTGKLGVSLIRANQLMDVVGDALKTNFTLLGPLVLPITEQVKFFFNLVARRYFGMRKKWRPYTPDFRKSFDHLCIHAAGRAVIDALEENLKLTPRHTEPSRATLHRWGNTSSSSIWYELSYIETVFSVSKGDVVWQLAFGSGFKCNTAVWRALRHVPKEQKKKDE